MFSLISFNTVFTIPFSSVLCNLIKIGCVHITTLSPNPIQEIEILILFYECTAFLTDFRLILNWLAHSLCEAKGNDSFSNKYTHSESLVCLECIYYLILDMALDPWRLQMHLKINTGLGIVLQKYTFLHVNNPFYLVFETVLLLSILCLFSILYAIISSFLNQYYLYLSIAFSLPVSKWQELHSMSLSILAFALSPSVLLP